MSRGRSLQSRNPPGPPGQRLKALREALGISGRDVQSHSRLIARSQGNKVLYLPQLSSGDRELRQGPECPQTLHTKRTLSN